MQLTKEQVAEIVDRSVKILHELKGLSGTTAEAGDLNDVYRDVGVLGLALKFQLEKDEVYQQAFKTLSEENVRLHMTVTTVAVELGEMAQHAAALQKDNEAWEKSFDDFVQRARESAEANGEDQSTT